MNGKPAVDYAGLMAPIPFEQHSIKKGQRGTWNAYITKSVVYSRIQECAPGTTIEMVPIDGSGARFGVLPEALWTFTWRERTNQQTRQKEWVEVRNDVAFVICRITLPDGARFENIGIDSDPQDAYTRALKRAAAMLGIGDYLDRVHIKAPNENAAKREFARIYAQWFGTDGIPPELLKTQSSKKQPRTPANAEKRPTTPNKTPKRRDAHSGKPEASSRQDWDIVKAIEWMDEKHNVPLQFLNAVLGDVGPLPETVKRYEWATREWFAELVEALGKRQAVTFGRTLTAEELKKLRTFSEQTFPFNDDDRKLSMTELAQKYGNWYEVWKDAARELGLTGDALNDAKIATEFFLETNMLGESDYVADVAWRYFVAFSQAFLAEIME